MYIRLPPTLTVVFTLALCPLMAHGAGDDDSDGVDNLEDNCTLVANAIQCDSDGDGYGNRCDGDMNNNTVVNSQDYVLFRQQLGQPSVAPVYNKADINCNTVVNSQDYVLFRGLLGDPPGPSAFRGTDNSYIVTGKVSGLTGSGLVLLNNGGDNLPVATNGPFAFATGVASGAGYDVSVLTQPTSPTQTCEVYGGTNTEVVPGALPNVSVVCDPVKVSAMVSGRIAGTALVLQGPAPGANEPLNILGNGYFPFDTGIASGDEYNISVASQPSNFSQTCTIVNGGTGTVGATEVTKTVQCASNGRFCYVPDSAAHVIWVYDCDPLKPGYDPDNPFTLVTSVTTNDDNPTSIVADPTGRFFYVTNAGASSGAVSLYTINDETGGLTWVNSYPTELNPKSMTIDPTGTFAWVPNCTANPDGSVSGYSINANGTLETVGPPVVSGACPRLLTLLVTQDVAGVSSNAYAYVTIEAATTNNVWTYAVNSDGTLEPVGTPITLPTDPSGSPVFVILP